MATSVAYTAYFYVLFRRVIISYNKAEQKEPLISSVISLDRMLNTTVVNAAWIYGRCETGLIKGPFYMSFYRGRFCMKRANKGNPILCGFWVLNKENSHHYGANGEWERWNGALDVKFSPTSQ
jgi:hypothetical protein